MPQARVVYNGEYVGDVMLDILHRNLPHIVARALNSAEVADAALAKNPNYVKVKFESAGKFYIGNALDVLILINFSHERRADLNERARKVAREVSELLRANGRFKVSVYIRLAPGGYAEV